MNRVLIPIATSQSRQLSRARSEPATPMVGVSVATGDLVVDINVV